MTTTGMRPGGLPPWHMWGGSVTLRHGGIGSQQERLQVARVSYGRPESWRFFLQMQLTEIAPADIPLLTSVGVSWKLQNGVGRVVAGTEASESLEQFHGQALSQVEVAAGRRVIWASSVLQSAQTPSGTPSVCDVIVGQDIQLSAAIAFIGNPSPVPFTVVATGMLVPNVHIRPDWFESAYLGNERFGQ